MSAISGENIQKYVLEPLQKVYAELPKQWKALDETVAELVDQHCTKKTAQFAKKLFRALPYASIAFCIPWSLVIPALGAVYMIHLAYGPLSIQTRRNMQNGTVIASTMLCAKNVLSFVAARNTCYLIAATAYGVFSVTLIAKRNAFRL